MNEGKIGIKKGGMLNRGGYTQRLGGKFGNGAVNVRGKKGLVQIIAKSDCIEEQKEM